MRKWVALLSGLAMLAAANYAIYGKERLVTEGRVVLLELAPVDPRSLMQGDYMALRFKVTEGAFGRGRAKEGWRDGRVVIRLDTQGLGSFSRFDDGTTLGSDEVRMRYRIRGTQGESGSSAEVGFRVVVPLPASP